MVRVNDRVVFENRAGNVTYTDDVGEHCTIRFDDGDEVNRVSWSSVIVTASVPTRVTFAYNVGDRVFESYTQRRGYVTERQEAGEGAQYKVTSYEGVWIDESNLSAMPLPKIDNDEMEELIANYLRDHISHMCDRQDEEQFVSSYGGKAKITIHAESSNEGEVVVEYTTMYDYSDGSAKAGNLIDARDETYRRLRADKEHTKLALPRRR